MYKIIEKNNNGYDKIYVNNDIIVPDAYKKMYESIGINQIIPTYDRYDEENIDLICFSLFEGKKYIAFDDINEYSIVMARVLINNNYEVYFKNEFIYKFISKHKLLHVLDNFDSLDKNLTVFIKDIPDMFMSDNNDKINYILAFHNMFFLQNIIDRNINSIKYIKIKISSINGIGIIPIYLKKLNNAFSKYNIKVVLDPTGTRYSVGLLDKIFSYDFSPDDMCDDNTIYLNDISNIMLTYFYIKSDGNYGYEIFDKGFLKDLDNFLNNTINDRKSLGLLIRGTDYISTDTLGEKRMAAIDALLPMIRDWVDKNQYESIFLATEDQDVLDILKENFGDKLYYVDQNRFRASDFKKGQTILDKEKEIYSSDEYQEKVDDTTIKYLYALYVLSKCDSLICSGMCNGYQVVKALNNNNYKKEYLYKG